MKTPPRLQSLLEEGLIDEVITRLMSGKEADVYVVRSQGEIRCAKVYKDSAARSFKKAAQYNEGRKSRNSRRARAMEKSSRYGREERESSWQNAEVDALFKLAAAGIRVPRPIVCVDGVLLMELIIDSDGHVAPRLGDVVMPSEQAIEDHTIMMDTIARMLCVGIIHGDLSEFNILVNETGPIVIDLPQAINASANNSAKAFLMRDVINVTRYYGQFAPELLTTRYAEEIWALYEAGDLYEGFPLTGHCDVDDELADVDAVLEEIKAVLAEQEEAQRESFDGPDS